MNASFLSPIAAGIAAGLFLLLPGAARAVEDASPTYVMKIGGEEETGKVVKSGERIVFLTCPGGKSYDIDGASLKKTWRRCPDPKGGYGSFGSFAGKILELDWQKGAYSVMTKDGETKSLSTAPDLLKGFAKGQDVWVAIDKSPASKPYAFAPIE
jgi:hypothetical protein